MAQALDPKELVSFETLLVTNTIQIDATEADFLDKLTEVQSDYQRRQVDQN